MGQKLCNLCPRACHVDRDHTRGRCHETNAIRIARASLHKWEEPCLSGTRGSGTVFFTGCPLGCVYCQNGNIANGQNGTVLSPEELTRVFLKLQDMGAHNINLVTPTHFVPQIRESLERAKAKGLTLPVVYNTGSYETVDTLKQLDGLVDIYLPDLKYFSEEPAKRYSHAPDYFPVAKDAISEMFRQVGTPQFDADGMMRKGLICRHLILPGWTEDSRSVLRYLWETYGDDIYVSIMDQYTPMPGIEKQYPELGRTVTPEEYDAVVDYAVDLGMTHAFVQEGEAASESFIPDFEHFDLAAFLQ